MTALLFILILAPIAGLAIHHFRTANKPAKPQIHAFPFPILSNGRYYEPPTFRPVDYSISQRDKKYDWPQA